MGKIKHCMIVGAEIAESVAMSCESAAEVRMAMLEAAKLLLSPADLILLGDQITVAGWQGQDWPHHEESS